MNDQIMRLVECVLVEDILAHRRLAPLAESRNAKDRHKHKGQALSDALGKIRKEVKRMKGEADAN